MSFFAAALVVASSFVAQLDAPNPWGLPPPEREGASQAWLEGRRIWDLKECGRCHEGTGYEVPVQRDRSCVECHRAILNGDMLIPEDKAGAWRSHIVSLREAPALNLEGRARSSWIAAFVRRPHKLRRGIDASMPRLPITEIEAEYLAAFLTNDVEPSGDAVMMGDPKRGLAVMNAKGCGFCHAYTGTLIPLTSSKVAVELSFEQFAAGIQLAPDLRVMRERTRPAAVDAWLKTTDVVYPRVMPHVPLTDDERADVVAAIFLAKLKPLEKKSAPERLPLLERKVRFSEVQERVLQKTCIHCHADDSANLGIGGPGNNGGFGYAGTGLVLSSYARTQAGSVSRDGTHKRMSIYRPVESGPMKGMPLLVAQLRARQIEEAGDVVEGVVGMPLGFPALTPEDLQLVESWVAQGRPQ